MRTRGTPPSPTRDPTLAHWENMASSYAAAKQRNAAYHDTIKALCRRLLPDAASLRVLEVGCGTGEILAALDPRTGVGVDCSARMVEQAQADHPAYRFHVASAEDLTCLPPASFDAVVLCDVLEHVRDVTAALRAPLHVLAPGGRLLVSTSNPLWAAPLWVLEKLRLKMPEGPHCWVGLGEIESTLRTAGYDLLQSGYQTLWPGRGARLFRLGDSLLRACPPLSRLALTEFALARRPG